MKMVAAITLIAEMIYLLSLWDIAIDQCEHDDMHSGSDAFNAYAPIATTTAITRSGTLPDQTERGQTVYGETSIFRFTATKYLGQYVVLTVHQILHFPRVAFSKASASLVAPLLALMVLNAR